MMKSQGDHMELVSSGDGPGRFDQIWLDKSVDPPKAIFIEAKGGSATNSSTRKIGDDVAQQGSAPYHADVWKSHQRAMEDQLDAIQQQLAKPDASTDVAEPTRQRDLLERSLDDVDTAVLSGDYNYLMATQQLNRDGKPGPGALVEFLGVPD